MAGMVPEQDLVHVLVQFGVNTTTEILLPYLWQEQYQDFCRDSLGDLGGARQVWVAGWIDIQRGSRDN